jgi:transposase
VARRDSSVTLFVDRRSNFRERLLDYAASHIQHMQKSLTEMNLQLQHVVTDITEGTGMRIIRAIIGGERNPAVLA